VVDEIIYGLYPWVQPLVLHISSHSWKWQKHNM